MKVILTKNVENIGSEGKIVEVRDGYARNFLLPRGLAVSATKSNIKVNAEKQSSIEKRHEKEVEGLQAVKEKLESLNVTMTVKAGQDGKLFGSITAEDLRKFLAEKKDVKVQRRNIDLKTPLKNVGTHDVRIRLGAGLTAKLTVNLETAT